MTKFQAWAKAHGFDAEKMNEDHAKAARSMACSMLSCSDKELDDDEAEEGAGKEGKSAATRPTIRAAAAGSSHADGGEGEGLVEGQQFAANMTKDIRAAALAERQRIGQITGLLDQYKPQIDAKKFADIEAKAFGGEWDGTRVELECIKARRPTPSAPNINTGAGSQVDGNIIAAAAARSMGVSEKGAFRGLDERSGNIAAGMRGITLHQIIAASAQRLGIHVSPGMIDDNFLGDFLRADKDSHRQQVRAAVSSGQMIRASSGAGFSTMSLTGITENILYKSLLEAYGLQVSVVSQIAYERDTNDFKPFKVYRLTASGDFQPLGPGGELKAFSLQDESYQNQVATKGALLTLKREDLINDDMGALMQATQVLGRKAAINREKTVFTTLLSGLSTTAPGASAGKTANAFNFFSAGANNFLTGASSALSLTSLQQAEQKFLQQTDANGDPVGILADRLLVPPELKVAATNIYNGASVVVGALGSTSSKSIDPNYNSLAGNFKPIVTPFLGGASSVTGHSATQWLLLPDPAGGMATVQVGYLRGQRTPVIRQVETDAAVLGLAYQGIFDFGVALLDYRCGVYSAGA